MMKKRLLLFSMACLTMFHVAGQTQTCGEKYRSAVEFKNAGIKTNDISKLNRAVYLFRQVIQCDPDMKYQCTKEINATNKVIKSLKPDLSVSSVDVVIPYQGGAKQIDVFSNGKWEIEGANEWCKTKTFENSTFAIECENPNNDLRNKVTTLRVKTGSVYKSIKVTQEGRPEFLEVEAKSLSFPARGTEDKITVNSNVNWNVSSVPSWCKVEKKDNGIHIIVTPNERVSERTDDIVVVSPTKSVIIKIYQGAGNESLSLSQNDLYEGANGGTHYIKVYTDAENWFIGDYPTWMHVQKVGNDSIRIACDKNVPNYGERTGSLQVRTDRQQVDLRVVQAERLVQDIVWEDSKVIGGRNISLGVSASYYLPFVGATAGGDYVGSVLDYGLGTSAENASYKSATGYSLGLFADVRLYKNIFLMAGANFTQVKYKNEFNKNTIYTQPRSAYEYMRGELLNSYTEEYSHTMIEVPILASYRFKVNGVSHVQLNFGPVLNFGLSSKMKVSGNSDCETMKIYNNLTHQPVDNSNYLHHTSVNAEFNLYQPCVFWEEMYTSGNDAALTHHDEFQEAPFSKVNAGLRFGVAYEWAGISFGLSYTQMLSNMAQKNYWDNERWTVLNVSDVTMKGYKHRINTFEFKLAYTLRYIKTKKNK